MDAQRGDVFATLIDARSERDARSRRSPRSPQRLLDSWRAHLAGRDAIFIGDAAARDAGADRRGAATAAGRSRSPRRSRRRSRALGASAARSTAKPDRRTRSTPIYVRRPDAEIERERAEPRVTERRDRAARDRPATSTACWPSRHASFNNPTTRDWYERELERPDVCFIYVLRTPEHPVAGFCAFWRVADQAHINNLAVRPELRGRGLGTQLLEAVIAEAAQLGAAVVTLEVRRSNAPALRLYQSAGFTQAGVRKNYYTQAGRRRARPDHSAQLES